MGAGHITVRHLTVPYIYTSTFCKQAITNLRKGVIPSLQNSPTTVFLRSLSLHERILLAALLRCAHHTGICEIPWVDVSHQHYLYAGEFVYSALLPRELEGVLDALLVDMC